MKSVFATLLLRAYLRKLPHRRYDTQVPGRVLVSQLPQRFETPRGKHPNIDAVIMSEEAIPGLRDASTLYIPAPPWILRACLPGAVTRAATNRLGSLKSGSCCTSVHAPRPRAAGVYALCRSLSVAQAGSPESWLVALIDGAFRHFLQPPRGTRTGCCS